jgi:hypothetical protein
MVRRRAPYVEWHHICGEKRRGLFRAPEISEPDSVAEAYIDLLEAAAV